MLLGLDWADQFYAETGKWLFYVLTTLCMSLDGDVCSCCSIHEAQEGARSLQSHPWADGRTRPRASTRLCCTYIACIGERPGLLSLPLLFVCSIAPLSSSLIALAKLPRVGFPMEAVVYRGILFSAIEACQGHKQIHEEPWLTFLHIAQHTHSLVPKHSPHLHYLQLQVLLNIVLSDRYYPGSIKGNLTSFRSGFKDS